VENLGITRQPLPSADAIYFLTPCEDSVNRLIEDFKDPKEPQYGTVHLFFSSTLPQALFTKLKSSNVVSRVKTFKELNLEFIGDL
jgi:hypothetical protein